ncbi:MAG: 3-dehydroquinate synthase [Deltaproteobacteria bacterium]|nr:3-dehydroquinate synthase [Deltaproteobacteria bacterium]
MNSCREIIVSPQKGPSYPVVVGVGLWARAVATIPPGRVCLIADRTVFDLYGPSLVGALERTGRAPVKVTFPAGERSKTRRTKVGIEDRMLAEGLGRDTVVLALGGGVTSDLAGFVAATYMRGVPYVNMPTSLLAMVDATVGGKTAVDTAAGKNLVGAFHQPSMVFVDLASLATLPREETWCGLAEMVKHAVVADAGYLSFLKQKAAALWRGEPDICCEAVCRSIEIKAAVVSQDTTEQGVRRVLNFGHTVAHALEQQAGWRLSHGKAVAAGMAVEAEVAFLLGLLAADDRDVLLGVLREVGIWHVPTFPDPDRLVHVMSWDKKAFGGKIRMALPEAVGRMCSGNGEWSVEVAPDLVLTALRRVWGV